MNEENKFDVNNKVHNAARLKELKALSLEKKIQITQARLIEWNNTVEGFKAQGCTLF